MRKENDDREINWRERARLDRLTRAYMPGKRIPDAGSANAKTSGKERAGIHGRGGGCGSWDMVSKEERRMR